MNEKDCNYKICVLSKNKRDIFPTSSSREKVPLKLVHIDICVPMQTQSIGGSILSKTTFSWMKIKLRSWIY